MKRILISLLCVGSLALSAMALAQHGDPKRPPRRPPPEAIDACKSKASGDSCSYTSPRGEAFSGTCWAPSEDRPLACRPAQRPRGR
jgi:hypothetical protein